MLTTGRKGEMRKREAKQDLVVFNCHSPQWGLCFIVDVGDVATIEELLRDKHIRHYTPYGQLKVVTTKELDKVPLFDCPICRNKDIPLLYKATMTKGDKEIDIWECACCGKVPNIDKDVRIKATVEL